MRAEPEPKLARTSGAYTVVRRLPNRLRTAAVATTTAEPSGSVLPGPTTSRSPVGTPCWVSTEHIAGSQAIIAPPLTWLAAQAAAWARTAAAWLTGPRADVWAAVSAEARCDPEMP